MTRLELYPAEIEAWRPPEKLTVSEWADRHRVLDPLTSAEPGPWRTDRVPYLAGVLDSLSDPTVEQITIIASTQVGKTEAQLNMMGYALDQDPGPTLFVMPREEDAVQIGQRRIKPMLENSPRLRAKLSGWASDNKQKEIRVGQTMLYLAGSNSPASLASRPVRYVLADEVDKYPAFSGKEADPISLAQERQRTFWNRKLVLTSTPTTRDGYIFRHFEASDRRRFWVPCARCGAFQVLRFPQVQWPEGMRDPDAIRRDRLAWYRCEHCEAQLDDQEANRMVRAGVWCPEGCKVDASGSVKGKVEPNPNRGFHLSSLYSPWLTFSEVAAKFLHAKDDVPQLLNFVNSWLGQPWEEKGEEVTPEYVATRAANHQRGEVPNGGLILTAGVDVQESELYYAIRAWGLGERSWLVEAGRVERWEALIEILFLREYPVLDRVGSALRVRLACIDSGYRTDEVYEIARRWLEVARPIKGQRKLSGGIPIRMTRVDRSKQGKMKASGVKVWHLDTSYFKDKLTRLIRTDREDVGAWALHADPAEEYIRQIASEHRVLRTNRRTGETSNVWVKKPGSPGNHFLDAEVYALAAAEMLAVHALRDESGNLPQPRDRTEELRQRFDAQMRDRTSTREADRERRGGWVRGPGGRGRRGGWMR